MNIGGLTLGMSVSMSHEKSKASDLSRALNGGFSVVEMDLEFIFCHMSGAR